VVFALLSCLLGFLRGFVHVRGWRSFAPAFDCPVFVIAGQVAVLAETFRVVRFCVVRAIPGLFRPALPVITVHAHPLRIVGLVGVWAVQNLPLLDLVGANEARRAARVATLSSATPVLV